MDVEIARTVPVGAILVFLLLYWSMVVARWARTVRPSEQAIVDVDEGPGRRGYHMGITLPIGRLMIALLLPVFLFLSLLILRG
jgi:hypothetical protein